MNRRTLAFLIVTLLLLGLAVWLGMKLASTEDKLSPYSAVYLETGDIYFGEYSRFPSPHLTNVWYLERGENSQVGLVPFKNVFWSPEEKITLNSDKIVLVAKIKAESQLAKAMSGEVPPQQNGSPAGTSEENTPNPPNDTPFSEE